MPGSNQRKRPLLCVSPGNAADPVCARHAGPTHVVLVELDTGEFYLVASPANESCSRLVSVDRITGALIHDGIEDVDVFRTEADAMGFIAGLGRVKSATEGHCVIGYRVLAGMGVMCLVTKVRPSLQLPSGDQVYCVADTTWVKMQLIQPRPPLAKGEARNLNSLIDAPIDGLHFFCETYDLTRTYAQQVNRTMSEDMEFVFNQWLAQPLHALGLKSVCPFLLQGLAEGRKLVDAQGATWMIALISRRSCLHPGTRYLARGLNVEFSPGNELECEQLVFPVQNEVEEQAPVSRFWSSYVWRRGTVPIWWGQEIKSSVSEAEIYVSERPYEGTGSYFQRLVDGYLPLCNLKAESNPNETADQEPGFICIVNLLRCAPGKPELQLSEHFQQGVRQVRQKCNFKMDILFINLDWHANIKSLGEVKAIEGYWARIRPSIEQGDLTVANGFGDDASYIRRQKGFMRYNCADSLDRTNLASYFIAVQALHEQCRMLGLQICREGNTRQVLRPNASANKMGVQATPTSPAYLLNKKVKSDLPAGWECRMDPASGKPFYIDHNTRTTTWTPPKPVSVESSDFQVETRTADSKDDMWPMYFHDVGQLKSETMPQVLSTMADLFLLNGDVHAALYTSSKAMHSAMIFLLTEGQKQSKGSAKAVNISITLQRRYKNIVEDGLRQQQHEMALGLHRHRHFPSFKTELQVVSRGATILKDIPSAIPNLYPPEALLLSSGHRAICWICPRDVDLVEIYMYLHKPCRVRGLLLTIMHGTCDLNSPRTFDLRCGEHLDDMTVVADGVVIPRSQSGTCLFYEFPLDAHVGGEVDRLGNTCLSNFDDSGMGINFLTRVACVTLRGYPGGHLTLGPIDLLGESLVDGDRRGTVGLSEESNWADLDAPTSVISGKDASRRSIVNAVDDFEQLLTPKVLSFVDDMQSGAVMYTNMLVSLLSAKASSDDDAQMQRPLTFEEALELELARVSFGLTAAERDELISSQGLGNIVLNPNKLLRSDMASRLRLYSTIRVGEGNSSVNLEPRSPTARSILNNSSNFDFLSDSFALDGSSRDQASLLQTVLLQKLHHADLLRKALKTEEAAVHALQTLSMYGAPKRENCSPLDVSTKMSGLTLNTSSASQYHRDDMKALAEELGSSGVSIPNPDWCSLAMYPYCSLLVATPTAEGAAHPDTLLAKSNRSGTTNCWAAPGGISVVELAVVIQYARVHAIAISSGSTPYDASEAPQVHILTGHGIARKELQKSVQLGIGSCHLIPLDHPVECDVVRVQLQLQGSGYANHVTGSRAWCLTSLTCGPSVQGSAGL
eukprot:scaffold630_cov399-Prasinococcus_capsulatus_cf.AAC.2